MDNFPRHALGKQHDRERVFLDDKRLFSEEGHEISSQPTDMSYAETAFDNAVFNGHFRSAKNIAEKYLGTFELQPYSPELFHIALKYLALPLYQRADLEARGLPVSDDIRDEIAALYGHATQFMTQLLNEKHEKVANTHISHGKKHDIIGDLTEATFFALTVRPLDGSDNDRFLILPSSEEQDRAGYDEHGLKRGIDFMILERGEGAFPLQTKTTLRGAYTSQYADSIPVIGLQDLTSNNTLMMRELQHAMIFEASNEGPYDIDLIEEVQDELFSLYDMNLGNKQPSESTH
jgi:hypothetical protein